MKNLRERIGLKILRLIDRYVDSFEKRIFIFIIFITMYWLWQNIWQLLLFYKVYFITDYESLFNLQAHLSNYESSVLIRIIYYVISNPSLNMAGLVSCIKLIDIMGIVGLLILAQKYRIIMITHHMFRDSSENICYLIIKQDVVLLSELMEKYYLS